jgi:hypothetical protein
MRFLLLVVVFLSGCGQLVLEDSQRIVCHATKEPVQCAAEDDVPRAYKVFSKHVMPIDPELPLIVHWYDWDHVFDIDNSEFKEVSGYSDLNKWPYEIHVRNTGVLMHELTHVALKETTGDPDGNHETLPGPWGAALNAGIELAEDEFGVTNGTPCPPEVCDG